jgi:LPS sulfotransferase NodH
LADRPASPSRFVVLAAPRTGSNWLCSLLNSHPDVLCHHEVFNPSGIFYALARRDGSLDLGTREERDRRPLAFLERVWRNPLGFACVGFKMTRGQDEQVLEAVLGDRGVRKIVVKRRNRVKTFVSELIARRTGQWEVYDRADLVAERPRVEVDPAELRLNVAQNDAYYARLEAALRRSGQAFVAVAYEELSSDRERLRLLEFLGVRPAPEVLRASSVKQNSTDLRRLVANFDELAAALRDTEFGPELYSTEM